MSHALVIVPCKSRWQARWVAAACGFPTPTVKERVRTRDLLPIMKIHVEVDLTPAEFRAVFGLPDLQPLQDEVMDKLREKMLVAVDAYDPMTFLAPFLPEGMRTWEGLQRAMWESMSERAKSKDQE